MSDPVTRLRFAGLLIMEDWPKWAQILISLIGGFVAAMTSMFILAWRLRDQFEERDKALQSIERQVTALSASIDLRFGQVPAQILAYGESLNNQIASRQHVEIAVPQEKIEERLNALSERMAVLQDRWVRQEVP